MLRTCNKIEIPPKPKMNEVRIRFRESFLCVIEVIEEIPFVISKKPDIVLAIKSCGTCKTVNAGVKIVPRIDIILVELRIDKILENSTIKPPIKSNIEIELVILLAKISPILDKFTCACVLLYLLVTFTSKVFTSRFQNLKTNPTTNEASKCEMKRRIPILVLLNINIPTVPIIKSGPELFVKLSKRSHSSLEQILFFLKSQQILAPIG